MKRLLLILTLAAVVLVVVFVARQKNSIPEIPFAKAAREEIVSALSTNGKVEPTEWAVAHAEAGGGVERIFVQKGQEVPKGAPLVELDARAVQSELASAQARIAQAQAELQTLRQGGRSSDVATIDSGVAAARQELAVAQREYETAKRLQAKNAGTLEEVRIAKDRVDRAQVQVQGYESRRTTLVNRPDIAGAEGRLREAEASAAAARARMSMTVIPAPISGIVYQFDLKNGAYLNPGDLVASIGKLDRVRVIVYVDEPDLGRVEIGKPVNITWDAMPGRSWKGAVERMPTQVTTLGARQVGEVSSVIDNPSRDLLPGTNVNVEIRSQAVQNAIVIPTAAVRRENGKVGVYLLVGDRIAWRDIKLGVASAARTQVDGLSDGDSVALPTDRPLKPAQQVVATYP